MAECPVPHPMSSPTIDHGFILFNEGIIAEGEELAKLAPNIVVKVPMIKDGVKALKYFSSKGIKTNCTLVFSAAQAILAAKAGATYISPFVGRVDDINWDGIALIEEIAEIYAIQMYDTYSPLS